ncbi:MAG: hypothetical protein IJX91_04655 [Clostridia bacterium]|nr:hypothetical protein [Clostridia bacterium]
MIFQVKLYGVSAVIAFCAVLITSLIKLVTSAIVKKRGKEIPSAVKEYIFTPLAIVLSGGGVFIWLTRWMGIKDAEFIILCTVSFAIATMFLYWLIFQPTRKLAVKLMKIVAERVRLKELAETLKAAADGKDVTKEDLQSIAKTDADKPPATADEEFHNAVNALKK